MWIKRSEYNMIVSSMNETGKANVFLLQENKLLKSDVNRLGDRVVDLTRKLKEARTRVVELEDPQKANYGYPRPNQ